MPFDYLNWTRQLKAVEREFVAIRLSSELLWEKAKLDPTILRGVAFPDIARARENLEGTFLIRMFAEFEAALRQYWRTYRPTDVPFRVRDLIEGVAASAHIDYDLSTEAHNVRRYRNFLAHHHEPDTIVQIPLTAARHSLNRFLSYLYRR